MSNKVLTENLEKEVRKGQRERRGERSENVEIMKY